MAVGGENNGNPQNRGDWSIRAKLMGPTMVARVLRAVGGDFEGIRGRIRWMDFPLSIGLFLVGLPA